MVTVTNQIAFMKKLRADQTWIMFATTLLLTVTLPVVLCGCETWSLTVRKEDGLKVSEENICN